jgi:Cu-Zn family superoxide dismutase
MTVYYAAIFTYNKGRHGDSRSNLLSLVSHSIKKVSLSLKMRASTILLAALSSLGLVAASPTAPGDPIKAVVVLNGEKVKGVVHLEQTPGDDETTITYEITGNDPNAKRGFHIHQLGDLTKGCASTAGHYNPFKKDHGAPTASNRHVGDLGNIQTDAKGVAKGKIVDKYVRLFGPTSVLGRAFVVHAGVDDEGKGASADSLKTGNAGGRNACGVIGLEA